MAPPRKKGVLSALTILEGILAEDNSSDDDVDECDMESAILDDLNRIQGSNAASGAPTELCLQADTEDGAKEAKGVSDMEAECEWDATAIVDYDLEDQSISLIDNIEKDPDYKNYSYCSLDSCSDKSMQEGDLDLYGDVLTLLDEMSVIIEHKMASGDATPVYNIDDTTDNQNHTDAIIDQGTKNGTCDVELGIISAIIDEVTTEIEGRESTATEEPSCSTSNLKTRKRQKNVKNWRRNMSKQLHNAGKEHYNIHGQKRSARSIKNKKDCTTCKRKCSLKVTDDERKNIFKGYWAMSKDVKDCFIASTTNRTKKRRNKTNGSRKSMSYYYTFTINGSKVPVCKEFYLGTLDIAQTVVYRVHSNKNRHTGAPAGGKQGKHVKKKISENMKDKVIEHIKSFPAISSHYCRARTSKVYLESQLNISKMYDMYVDKCKADNEPHVKKSYYRNIFNKKFNIDFHMPKSDRCDVCERFRCMEEQLGFLNEEDRDAKHEHMQHKMSMRAERNKDRAEKNKLVITFDLQNVVTLPKAEIGSFFYLKKLSLYNLTTHDSITRRATCVVWPENTRGRSGNDLASAIIKAIEIIIKDHPDITNITTWSDSCIPQNRNSIISYAMIHFMDNNPRIESITMKYSVPGHGAVQEVDNIHSNIEKAQSVAEYYSPISYVRVLLHVNRHHPYKVYQMKQTDFLDYQSKAKALNFTHVHFSKVAMITFEKRSLQITYKTSFHSVSATEVVLWQKSTTKTRQQNNVPSKVQKDDIFPLVKPKVLGKAGHLATDKQNDIRKMLDYMPLDDRAYYNAMGIA